MKNLKWPKLWAILWYPLSQKLLILVVGMIIIMVVGIFAIFGNAKILAMFNEFNILAYTPFINALTIIGTLLTVFAWLQTKNKYPPVMPPEPNQEVVVEPPIKLTEELVNTSSHLSFVSNSIDKYDIFVSYAETDKNWATLLINNLQERLSQELRGESYSVWMDDVLTGNTPSTDKLEKSAILLIILSEDYLDSKQSELTALLAHINTESGCVFIVESNEVQRPESIANLKPYQFIVKYGSIYEGQEYYPTITSLANNLTDKLKELKTPPRAGDIPKNAVFLAEVTDDLEKYRERFKKLLEQQGYVVLPRQLYDKSQQLHGYNEDIKKSIAFIQLLSDRWAQSEFPLLQYQCAKPTYKPILQWRSGSLEVEKVTNDRHRMLLELDTVRAKGIEEFRHEVLQVLQAIKQPPTQPQIPIARATQQHLSDFWIFVNAIQADEQFARKLSKYIFAKCGISCISPIYEGKPRKLYQEHEKNMRGCHAMVVIYGQSEPEWVRDQFRDLVKFSCRNNAQPCLLPGGAVCEVSPLPKPPLNISFQSFRCTDDSLENIDHFLDDLRNHA